MSFFPEVCSMSEPEVENILLCCGGPVVLPMSRTCQGRAKSEKRGMVLAQRKPVVWKKQLERHSSIHWLPGIIPTPSKIAFYQGWYRLGDPQLDSQKSTMPSHSTPHLYNPKATEFARRFRLCSAVSALVPKFLGTKVVFETSSCSVFCSP